MCATQQGLLFTFLTLDEQLGYKIHSFSLDDNCFLKLEQLN